VNFLSAFIEGVEHFPASKISIAGTAENGDFYGKDTPFLCLLFYLFLNLYNNGNSFFAKDGEEKQKCNFNSYWKNFIIQMA